MIDNIPDPVPIEIVTHPLAPLYGVDPEVNTRFLTEAIDVMHRPQIPSDKVDLIRQTGYVSLWFFTKYIAGFSGPFNKMTTHLHVSMANYRQRLLRPGARGAMFIPRSHYKTALATEAGSGWEILRWPDIKIRITNAISDIAHDFMHSVQRIFDDNALVAFLYPHLYVGNPTSQPRWNDSEMVSPGRTRRAREATIEAGGVGGGIEGHHYDLHVVDDMIGQKSLNSSQMSAAEMERARNWFWNNEKSLLQSVRDSRVIVIGTRYAIDDVYDDILRRARSISGYDIGDFEPDPEKGVWDVYYRAAVEDGQVIFPENWTIEAYEDMKNNPDTYWTWINQFMNNPRAGGVAEFSQLPLKKFTQTYEDGVWWILFYSGGEEVKIPLTACDVVAACDPGATEKRVSAKTSRSAQGVVATDPEGRRFIVSVRAEYAPITRVFDWMFTDRQTYKPRVTALEMNGPFRMLRDILTQEQLDRGQWLNLLPVTASGDKDASIRTQLEPELNAGRLYVDERYYDMVWEEISGFPNSLRKDILDMLKIALKASVRPLDEGAERLRRRLDRRWSNRSAVNAAGY